MKKSKLKNQQNQIEIMITMYCKKYHTSKDILCDKCKNLLNYANKKVSNCPYIENKPNCKNCPTKCYNKDMQKDIIKVMRYSGPRLIFSHPIMAIDHIINLLRYKFTRNP